MEEDRKLGVQIPTEWSENKKRNEKEKKVRGGAVREIVDEKRKLKEGV